MVAATHGRSLWVLNVTPLRQTNARTFGTTETLFAAAPAVRFHSEPRRGGTNRRFEGTNAPSGGVISYHLPADAQRVSVKIMDVEGKVLRELQAPNKAGLNQVVWNMTQQQQGRGPGGFGGPGGGFGPGGAGGRLGRGPGGAGAEAGTQAAELQPRALHPQQRQQPADQHRLPPGNHSARSSWRTIATRWPNAWRRRSRWSTRRPTRSSHR